MSDDTQLFADVFAADGGAWPLHNQSSDNPLHVLDNSLDVIRTIMEAYQSIVRDPSKILHTTLKPLPPINFGFIDSVEMNGFALRHGESYMCGLTAPLAMGVLEMVNHFMSMKHLFPKMGDASQGAIIRLDGRVELPLFQLITGSFGLEINEDIDAKLDANARDALMKNLVLLRRGSAERYLEKRKETVRSSTFYPAYELFLKWGLPVSAERREIAIYIAHTLGLFLWMHEVAHVMEGHVDFVMAASEKEGLRLCEFPHQKDGLALLPNRIGSFDRTSVQHAMELDADLIAATCVIGMIHDDNEVVEVDLPKEDRLVVVMTFLIIMLQTLSNKKDAAPANSHPPFRERLFHLLISLFYWTESRPEINEAIMIACKIVQSLSEEEPCRHYLNLLPIFDPKANRRMQKDWRVLLGVGRYLRESKLKPYINMNMMFADFMSIALDRRAEPAELLSASMGNRPPTLLRRVARMFRGQS